MVRSITPRFDFVVSALAAICLIGPMVMGLAASVGASI